MGYDIDFFGAGLVKDLLYARRKLLGAECDRGRGMVVAVIDLRAVALELLRDPAPIVEDLAVAEADSVDEKNGIFRRADAICGTRAVDLFLSYLEIDLAERGSDDRDEAKEVCNRYHTADSADDALLYAELNRGQIDAYNAVPEDHEINTECEKGVPKPHLPVAGYHFEGKNDMSDHRNACAGQKYRKQYRTVMADAKAEARCFDRKHARKEIKYHKRGNQEIEVIDIRLQKREGKPAESAENKVNCVKKNMWIIIWKYIVKNR